MRPKVKEGVRKRWEIGNWKNCSIALSSGGGGFKENVCLPSVNGYIYIDISIYIYIYISCSLRRKYNEEVN